MENLIKNEEISPESEVHSCACSENSDKIRGTTSKVMQIVFTPDLHSNISSLKLKDKEIQDFVFSSILQRVAALKFLDMTNVKLIKTDDNNNNEIQIFPKELESLVIENSDFELLSFFHPSNLQQLRIVSNDLRLHQPLKKFLTQCLKLTKLELIAIDDCDIMNFFTPIDLSFRLKYLLLSSMLTKIAATYENEEDAIKFLNYHCNTLHTLEIQTPLPEKVLGFALKKFRLLRTLLMRTNLIPLEGSFYPQKHPKKSVKLLTLEGPYINAQQTAGILKLYPVIKSFYLDNIYPDIAPETVAKILKAVSTSCPTLYELSIPRVPCLTPDVRFKSLSVLRIKYINEINEIKSIMRNSPNLRKIYVEHVFRGQCNEELIGTLLGSNIRSLLFGAEPCEVIKIFNLIENFPASKLDYLEFRVHTLNFYKSYQFRYHTLNGIEANYASVKEEMCDDLKDFILKEALKGFDEENEAENDDSSIINYVTNSFEFS